MSNKLQVISIVGSTATGKTNLAFQMIKQMQQENPKQGFDIVSADSRQVYKGIKIISGADVPEGFEFVDGFFQKGKVRIFGVGILEDDQDWSVAHFRDLFLNVAEEAKRNQRVILVVGGTGLYHQHMNNLDPTLSIPPDEKVRQQAAQLDVAQLQAWLQKVAPQKFAGMNQSDQNNPRRLVRAIEVALNAVENSDDVGSKIAFEHQIIGVRADLSELEAKISDRVAQRFKHGAIDEVTKLLGHWPQVSRQLKTATGVMEIKQFIEGQISESECLARWALREFQYAKRQITWWKNKRNVQWTK